jgi:hypothetical protein
MFDLLSGKSLLSPTALKVANSESVGKISVLRPKLIMTPLTHPGVAGIRLDNKGRKASEAQFRSALKQRLQPNLSVEIGNENN